MTVLLLKVECDHKGIQVEFDIDEAFGLLPSEVREKYPRFDGPCPGCGLRFIAYASYEHMYLGDW